MEHLQVVVLAGGLATRLRPLSLYRPKALLPICNESVLKRLLRSLQQAGITEATLDILGDSEETISYVWNQAPAGFHLEIAAGPYRGKVRKVYDNLLPATQRTLVIYGDSLIEADFGALIARHKVTCDSGGVATILYHDPADLYTPDHAGRTYHGVMALDQSGKVSSFVEKPLIANIAHSNSRANAAVFICERSVLEWANERQADDFSYDVFQPIVAVGSPACYGCDIGSGFRLDVGTVASLYQANIKSLTHELNLIMPGNEVRPGVWFEDNVTDLGSEIEPPVLIGRNVVLNRNSHVGPNAVIGEGTTLSADASVRRSVLFDRCSIGCNAKINSCILASQCRIGAGVILRQHTVIGAFSVIEDSWPAT